MLACLPACVERERERERERKRETERERERERRSHFGSSLGGKPALPSGLEPAAPLPASFPGRGVPISLRLGAEFGATNRDSCPGLQVVRGLTLSNDPCHGTQEQCRSNSRSIGAMQHISSWTSLCCSVVPGPSRTFKCRGMSKHNRNSSGSAMEGKACLKGVQLLRALSFGDGSDQSLEGEQLPGDLHTVTLGLCFNQSFEGVQLPSGLRALTLSYAFDQSLEGVQLFGGQQTLTFGNDFNQSLEGAQLPSGLQTLPFVETLHNKSLEGAQLPSLQTVTFAASSTTSTPAGPGRVRAKPERAAENRGSTATRRKRGKQEKERRLGEAA